MKIFLDTANLDELKKGAEWGIVDGVTTNPIVDRQRGPADRRADRANLRHRRR